MDDQDTVTYQYEAAEEQDGGGFKPWLQILNTLPMKKWGLGPLPLNLSGLVMALTN